MGDFILATRQLTLNLFQNCWNVNFPDLLKFEMIFKDSEEKGFVSCYTRSEVSG